jgi:4-hydroxybenzoate polyprenyltransferase
MIVRDLISCLRVRQWTKNILICAALIFSGHAHQFSYAARTLAAILLFSLASGAVYIFNDIQDIVRDREHPLKKFRPIASGAVSEKNALISFFVLVMLALPAAFLLDTGFGLVVLGYIAVQILYSLFLKNIVILDVIVISLGFLLRVIAGAVVIHVEISNWILVCTMLLSLFLALSKRRHELTLLDDKAYTHRTILSEYSAYLLDQMIGVVTSATLIAYIIFTLSDETAAKFGKYMILTVPFVLYGIFRYLYLVHRKDGGGQPEEILLSDTPLQLVIIAYGIVAVIIIYV